MNFANEIEEPSITMSISIGFGKDRLWNLVINKSLIYPPTKATLLSLLNSMYFEIRLNNSIYLIICRWFIYI